MPSTSATSPAPPSYSCGRRADHYRLAGLPAILLVDEDGKVTFKLMRIDTYDQLPGLVEDHTGVRVTAG